MSCVLPPALGRETRPALLHARLAGVFLRQFFCPPCVKAYEARPALFHARLAGLFLFLGEFVFSWLS